MSRISKKEISGRRERQYKRRMEASRLFEAGKSRAEVARELKVSWRATHEWYKQWISKGSNGLKSKGKPGPGLKISDGEAAVIIDLLKKGSIAQGYPNEIWTLRRIRKLVLDHLGKKVSVSEAWRLMKRIGWTLQKPQRKARERDQELINEWKEVQWPKIVEKAKLEKRTIIFVDECGFSQKSVAHKTWSPQGETPIIQMTFSWDKLSVIGGISLKSIYFQVHEETIKSKQVVEFLNHLQRYIKGKILVVWDGLRAHRSKEVAEYLASTCGRVWVERLPAYAPELNPIEYLWGNVKNNDLSNLAPKDLWDLSKHARDALFKKRRRPKLIQAFWIQTELNLEGL